MDIAKVKSDLEKALPEVKFKTVQASLLIENPEDLPKVAQWLKTSPDYRLDLLTSVTGADYLTYLESVYHFYSVEKRLGPVVLRVRTDRTVSKIPSLVSLYRGAEFQEREAYDTYGIVYVGHPDLRRLFMWEGFEGYPLRKDYQQEDSETLEMADVQWLTEHGVKTPEEMKQKAEALHKEGKRSLAQTPKPGAEAQ